MVTSINPSTPPSIDVIRELGGKFPEFREAQQTLENQVDHYSIIKSGDFDEPVRERMRGDLHLLARSILMELALLKSNGCSSDTLKNRVTSGLQQMGNLFEEAKKTQAQFKATMDLTTQAYKASIAKLKKNATPADLKPANVRVEYDFPHQEEMRKCLAKAPQINGPGVRLPTGDQHKALDVIVKAFATHFMLTPKTIEQKIDGIRLDDPTPLPGDKLPRSVQDPLLVDAIIGCAKSRTEINN